jgi:Protein of unknown function (DUF2877)
VTAAAAIDAGEAWHWQGRGSWRGSVVAVFRRSAYLCFGRRVLAVVHESLPPGPLHLRLAPFPHLTVADVATIESGVLHLAGGTIGLPSVPCWRPDVIDPAGLARAGPAVHLLSLGDRSALMAEPEVVAGAAGLADRGRLEELADLLGGRGPGLTPAGDDVLAGILLVAALAGTTVARLVGVAHRARTSDLSQSFVEWAARGASIAPVHDLVAGLCAPDAAVIFRAQAVLAGIGASSGADLVLGLRLALKSDLVSPAIPIRTAAAPARPPSWAGRQGCASDAVDQS